MQKVLAKVAVTLAAIVAIAAVPAWFYYDALHLEFVTRSATPAKPFDDATSPVGPNYADDASWAALPTRKDDADFAPDGEADEQISALVDVFFVHPTTYRNAGNWNQPLDDREANEAINLRLRGQASVFNACCRVFAPRYRQANLAAIVGGPSAIKARQLAYHDVERAFVNFIEHRAPDRPFILAGHSQGSIHLARLLKERVSKSPLLARMVAAYPIGGWMKITDLPGDIPICTSPTQTGCLVTWNAVGPERRLDAGLRRLPWDKPEGNICVNPLSWRTDGARADYELNLGSYVQQQNALTPHIADAQCRDGELFVSKILSGAYDKLPFLFGHERYHGLDYSLFYLNLRRNAKARVDAYLAAHAQ